MLHALNSPPLPLGYLADRICIAATCGSDRFQAEELLLKVWGVCFSSGNDVMKFALSERTPFAQDEYVEFRFCRSLPLALGGWFWKRHRLLTTDNYGTVGDLINGINRREDGSSEKSKAPWRFPPYCFLLRSVRRRSASQATAALSSSRRAKYFSQIFSLPFCRCRRSRSHSLAAATCYHYELQLIALLTLLQLTVTFSNIMSEKNLVIAYLPFLGAYYTRRCRIKLWLSDSLSETNAEN